MNKLRLIFLVMTMLVTASASLFASPSGEISELTERIRKSEKVDQLYTIKYNLDKIADNKNISINDLRDLIRAHQLLSGAFKSFNHFKNAIDVHNDYQKLVNQYHLQYQVYLKDSLQEAGRAETSGLLKRINILDEEIAILKQNQGVISELRNKYLLFGGLAASAIILIVLVVVIRRNATIRELNNQIQNHRVEMESVFRNVTECDMAAGTLKYAAHIAAVNYNRIEETGEYYKSNGDVKVYTDSIKSIENAKLIFGSVGVDA